MVAVLPLLLGPVALTACSSDDAPDPGAASSTAAPSSSPSSPSAPSSAPPTEPGTPSPTVEPATGPEVVITDLGDPVLRLRVPDDGEWEADGTSSATAFLPDSTMLEVSGRTLPTVAGRELDYYVRLTQRAAAPLEIDLRRTDNRVVDGIEGYVVEGFDPGGAFYYYFGAISGDVQADVIFQLGDDGAASRALVDSVLASAQWV